MLSFVVSQIFNHFFLLDNANDLAFPGKNVPFDTLFTQMIGDSFPSGNAPL